MFLLFFLFLFLLPRLPLLVRDFFDVFLSLLPEPEPCPCLWCPGDTALFAAKSTMAELGVRAAAGRWAHRGRITARPACADTWSRGCALLSIPKAYSRFRLQFSKYFTSVLLKPETNQNFKINPVLFILL